MTIPNKALVKIIWKVGVTQEHEPTCDECFEEVDRVADEVLLPEHSRGAEQAQQLVKTHINVCGECHDEYDALLAALQRLY